MRGLRTLRFVSDELVGVVRTTYSPSVFLVNSATLCRRFSSLSNMEPRRSSAGLEVEC